MVINERKVEVYLECTVTVSFEALICRTFMLVTLVIA